MSTDSKITTASLLHNLLFIRCHFVEGTPGFGAYARVFASDLAYTATTQLVVNMNRQSYSRICPRSSANIPARSGITSPVNIFLMQYFEIQIVTGNALRMRAHVSLKVFILC